MLKRELVSAKRNPHSLARLAVMEAGMNAIAVLILELLGEVEGTAKQRESSVRDIRLLIYVLDDKQTKVPEAELSTG